MTINAPALLAEPEEAGRLRPEVPPTKRSFLSCIALAMDLDMEDMSLSGVKLLPLPGTTPTGPPPPAIGLDDPGDNPIPEESELPVR